MALALVRIIVLCASDLLAAILFGVSLNTPGPLLPFITSIFHFASVTPMILTGLFRDGVWTSYLGFEFAWLTILWILWLTGGGLNATYFRSGANIYTTALEEQVQVVSGFCFLIWMMLFGYTITLLAFVIKAAKAGHTVWMNDVRRVRWVNRPAHFEKLDIPYGTPHPTPAATYPPHTASSVSPRPQVC